MSKVYLPLVLALAVSVSACGTKLADTVVAGDSAVVNTLLDVKASKDVPCDAGQIPASTCQALAKAFVPVWDGYLAVNAAISAESPVTEVDRLVSEFKSAGQGFKDVVESVQGDYKRLILDAIEVALRRFDSR